MKPTRFSENQFVSILKEAATAFLLFMVVTSAMLIFLTGVDIIGRML